MSEITVQSGGFPTGIYKLALQMLTESGLSKDKTNIPFDALFSMEIIDETYVNHRDNRRGRFSARKDGKEALADLERERGTL